MHVAAPRWLAPFALLCAGCQTKRPPPPPEPLGPSPNASILPAPLASASELSPPQRDGGVALAAQSAARVLLEAAPPEPRALREDVALARDGWTTKDNSGLTLEAEWRWPDVQPAPGADASPEAYKAARDKTSFRSKIDLAPAGRMRLLLSSGSFPLPTNTELRARSDSLGHILVWPDGSKYRVLPPGTLRAMFSERRTDVTPLVAPRVRAQDSGNLLGHPTIKRSISTPTGELLLELASVPGAGAAGDLLCRLLLELIAAAPDVPVCEDGGIPLRAEFKWPGGGSFAFDATGLLRRQDLATGDLYFPPAAAQFTRELPPQASGVLLSQTDLAELRRRAVPGKEPSPPGAPGEGLLLVNRTDALRYVLLDGVPIAWVRPQREQYVLGPRAGRYVLGFRDFLGQSSEPGKPISVPARAVLGSDSDAGAASE